MSKIKREVIQLIESLPDEVTIGEIMAELHFRLNVDAGLNELDKGEYIDHLDVKKRMSKWLTNA